MFGSGSSNTPPEPNPWSSAPLCLEASDHDTRYGLDRGHMARTYEQDLAVAVERGIRRIGADAAGEGETFELAAVESRVESAGGSELRHRDVVVVVGGPAHVPGAEDRAVCRDRDLPEPDIGAAVRRRIDQDDAAVAERRIGITRRSGGWRAAADERAGGRKDRAAPARSSSSCDALAAERVRIEGVELGAVSGAGARATVAVERRVGDPVVGQQRVVAIEANEDVRAGPPFN